MSVDPLRLLSTGGFDQVALGSVYQAPSDKQHGVLVVVASLGQLGPMPWGPERGTTLPAAGDPCIIVFPSNGSPWVTNWWPASYQQGIA
jgi:hypothetical protein